MVQPNVADNVSFYACGSEGCAVLASRGCCLIELKKRVILDVRGVQV